MWFLEDGITANFYYFSPPPRLGNKLLNSSQCCGKMFNPKPVISQYGKPRMKIKKIERQKR